MAMADNIVISEMTWTEVDEAMKDRPVAILPVGAIEAHGPHLPAQHRHRDRHRDGAARGGQAQGARACARSILPPVYVHRGRLRRRSSRAPSASPRRLRWRCCATSASSPSKKFRAVAIANIHLEPGHIECLKAAVEEAQQGGRQRLLGGHHQEALGGDLLGEAFAQGRPRGRLRDLPDDGGRAGAWCASASASAWPPWTA